MHIVVQYIYLSYIVLNICAISLDKTVIDLKNARCEKLPVNLADACTYFAEDISTPFIHIFYSIEGKVSLYTLIV
jgi:hypothetical protein